MKFTECSCDICKKMCTRPCWPTPKEAEKLIEAGFAEQLMLDYWFNVNSSSTTYILSPAWKGYEGRNAPLMCGGFCTFYKDGLCELHVLGLKPSEGKLTNHVRTINPKELHKKIALLWESKRAKAIVQRWLQLMKREAV